MAARISLDAMPLLRDQHVPVDYSGQLVSECVLRRLFVDSPANSGGCAVDADPRDDGRRWRVRLDRRHRWSDGRPIRPSELVTAAEHAVRSRSSAVALFLDDDSAGAPVRVVDADTVEYRFRRPIGFVPALLSLPAFAPKAIRIDDSGREVSLGSYVVDDWSPELISLSRNEFAVDGQDTPDELAFVHVPTATEAVAQYEAGAIEATSPTGFGIAEVTALAGRPDTVVTPIDIVGSLEFGRHAPRGWLASAAARRTVAALIDRAALAAGTYGLTLPWSWPGPDRYGPGVAEGSATEAEIALAAGAVTEPLDIVYSAFDPNTEIVTAVAAQLERALGVPVRTTELSYPDYIRRSMRSDHCLLYSLTVPAFPHPAATLSDWRSTGRSARRIGLADPVLDGLLDRAEACLDSGADGRWAEAGIRWCELLPRIPLIRVNAWFLRGGPIANLDVSTNGLLRFGRTPARTAWKGSGRP